MNSEELLVEIAKKLDMLIGLKACEIASRVEPGRGQQARQIEALGVAGLPNDVIAGVLGTTAGTVRATLNRAKKNRGAAERSTDTTQ